MDDSAREKKINIRRNAAARKEKLTIYLAKNFTGSSEGKIIKLENSKPPLHIEIEGLEARLFVKREKESTPPPWTKLFTDHQEIPEGVFGERKSVGAALLIHAEAKTFVITFGTGFHLLNNEAVERDFGLRVTLNSVNPEKLRSLDKASYDHNPLNYRTQSSIELGVFDLDVDSEMDMLYAVTGASNVPAFGSHVTGRDALTLVLDIKLSNIKTILDEAATRYDAPLPKNFEWVENIQRVKDKDLVGVLDLELDDELSKTKLENMWLGEPEIIDWENHLGYSFDLYPKTPRHIVLSTDDLVQYFEDRKISLTSNSLKSQVVHINDSEYKSVKCWSAYRCLYAEVAVGNEQYILRNGCWYRVDVDFASRVDKYLENLDLYDFKFPLYTHDREEDYNSWISRGDGIELMDKKLAKIGGPHDKLEFCDLIRDGCELIHVKYYRSSSSLSHLFSQGFVAAEAFISDPAFRHRLNEKLPSSSRLADPEERPDPGAYRIVYAIATNRELPINLPFFSKVTLKNSLKTLRSLNYRVSLVSIPVDPDLEKRKKIKPGKNRNL